MTAVQKKRMRRRRKFKRNTKRLILNILLMPARMPRISGIILERTTQLSDVTGLLFMAVLIGHMFNSELIGTFPVVATALAFAVCLLALKIGDYQDQLEELKYYGYKIS